MKSRYEREQELIKSGLFNEIKRRFNYNPNISDEYYMLMTDYISSLDESNGDLHVNAVQIASALPQLINSIKEMDLGGVYGRTDEHNITMNSRLSYEQKKLYFFHEMTHAVQTFKINNQEICSLYNGNDGMFLTEGLTQYTAEYLYNVSNGTTLNFREQRGVVRGQNHHTTYSPLSEYQLNGNMIQLLSKSTNIPIVDIIQMGYRPNGRDMLKSYYETYNTTVSFDELMSNLEKIYNIDKLVIYGYSQQLSGQPIPITATNGQTFQGSLQIENDLIVKTERDFMYCFFENNDEEYIKNNYQEFCAYLTTPQLKKEFLNAVKNLEQFVNQTNMQNQNTMSLGYRPSGFANNILLSIISIILGLVLIYFIVKGVLK